MALGQRVEDDESEQAPQGFVKKGGMEAADIGIFGQAVGGIDGHSPGQIGGTAVQLLVEKVAPTAEYLAQGETDDSQVSPGQHWYARAPGVEEKSQGAASQAAVNSQAAVAKVDELVRVLKII